MKLMVSGAAWIKTSTVIKIFGSPRGRHIKLNIMYLFNQNKRKADRSEAQLRSKVPGV